MKSAIVAILSEIGHILGRHKVVSDVSWRKVYDVLNDLRAVLESAAKF